LVTVFFFFFSPLLGWGDCWVGSIVNWVGMLHFVQLMFSQMHIHLPYILLKPVLPVFQQAPFFHYTFKKESWPCNSLLC
jgi:hypothetical protein